MDELRVSLAMGSIFLPYTYWKIKFAYVVVPSIVAESPFS